MVLSAANLPLRLRPAHCGSLQPRVAGGRPRRCRRAHAGEIGHPAPACWRFFGPGRVADFQFGNGVRGTHMNDAGKNAAVQQGVPLPPWGGPCSDRLGYDGAVQRDS